MDYLVDQLYTNNALPVVILLKSPCIDYIKPVSQSVQNQRGVTPPRRDGQPCKGLEPKQQETDAEFHKITIIIKFYHLLSIFIFISISIMSS